MIDTLQTSCKGFRTPFRVAKICPFNRMIIMKTAKAAKNTGIVHLSVTVFKTLYRSYPLFLNFLSQLFGQWPNRNVYFTRA